MAYPLWIMGICMLCFSCTKDTVTEHYSFYRPIYAVAEQVKAAIKSAAPEPVQQPGKLAIRGNYLYLSELNKGVHIIDFSNPRLPVNIGFVAIPGVVDLAVRDHYLYADCYISLAVVDISQPQQAVLTNFIDGVFPDRFSGLASDRSKIITSWQKVDTTITYRLDHGFDKTLNKQVVFNDVLASSNSSIGSGNSTGGSMARFALNDDRLYTVGFADLSVFNTANASLPVFVKKVRVQSSGIETIFPYKQKLFIGSQTGMSIYSISDKDSPSFLSVFQHVRVCDPVIADDTHAYVTLRNGTACGGFTNQLEVLDIADLANPVKLKTYPLKNPRGLSKDGNLLFICDGSAGVKLFDATNPVDLKPVKTIEGLEANDVIAHGGVAIVMTTNGVSFVDYTTPATATVVSTIAVANK